MLWRWHPLLTQCSKTTHNTVWSTSALCMWRTLTTRKCFHGDEVLHTRAQPQLIKIIFWCAAEVAEQKKRLLVRDRYSKQQTKWLGKLTSVYRRRLSESLCLNSLLWVPIHTYRYLPTSHTSSKAQIFTPSFFNRLFYSFEILHKKVFQCWHYFFWNFMKSSLCYEWKKKSIYGA